MKIFARLKMLNIVLFFDDGLTRFSYALFCHFQQKKSVVIDRKWRIMAATAKLRQNVQLIFQ